MEHFLKSAVCQVQCGAETGSGWVAASNLVVTAWHCVAGATEQNDSVALCFPTRDASRTISARVTAHDTELDVAILTVEERLDIAPLQVSSTFLREGSSWVSFGFPHQKGPIGHRFEGRVAQVFSEPLLRIDADLTVNADCALTAYAGMSGAPLLVAGYCVGMIRLKVDAALGAVTMRLLSQFLSQHGIAVVGASDPRESVGANASLAMRPSFQVEFETALNQANGRFLFLEGAHGMGKTTFCTRFAPTEPNLLILGTYSLTLPGRGGSSVVRAQPSVFYDWLLTAISTLLAGKADRKTELGYPEMVDRAAQLLEQFGAYCAARSVQGVLFVDGVNEGYGADASAMTKLIGLLSVPLPSNVVVVLTAPNHQAVSAIVTPVVRNQDMYTLPRLSDEACIEYCRQQLRHDPNNLSLLEQICVKAQGHPLYLRYLIEYLNEAQTSSLQDFPALSGTIEQYYETIWARLLGDADAVQLLGILARLRWGIPTDVVFRMLSPAEQAVYGPTMSRIRHLLRAHGSTEIYHASFKDFVREKTTHLDQLVHERIAEFCTATQEVDYCTLNLIHHLLKGGDASIQRGVALCQQDWIDACVLLGVEPDTAMDDIGRALSAATHLAQGTEVLRLLLLQQRVSFRYNVLFTQAASLVANALIALGRPNEALQFAVRFDTLVTAPDEAIIIVDALLQRGYNHHASTLLRQIHRYLVDLYERQSERPVAEFVELSRLLLQRNLYAMLADGRSRMRERATILRRSLETLGQFEASAPAAHAYATARIVSVPISWELFVRGKYANLQRLRSMMPGGATPPAYLLNLFQALHDYVESSRSYRRPNETATLAELFDDLGELLRGGEPLPGPIYAIDLDILIELGAPATLVRQFLACIEPIEARDILVIGGGGVDINPFEINYGFMQWRVLAYTEPSLACPAIGAIDSERWQASLEQLFRAIAWCDGRARCAISNSDAETARAVLSVLTQHVLPVMHFTLEQRTSWQHCYAIPEAVFPIAWQKVASLLRACYPDQLADLLQGFVTRSREQLGLYTEGFRRTLEAVMKALLPYKGSSPVEDELFSVLEVWKQHVLDGVENRHELVPELLKLVTLFARVGADEQARVLYAQVLRVSMGPSWYKEEQFKLLTIAIEQLPVTDVLDNELSTIAGYLQRASGEMTFQRYVRYEKEHLIAELFRRHLTSNACRYIQRQSCGSWGELLEDVQAGKIDQVTSVIGMRYPGGSLDEQAVVLALVRYTPRLDWKLRWALLDIFQCGDERHLADFAGSYAQLINDATSVTDVDAMFARLAIVVGAEVSITDRSTFLQSFLGRLDAQHHARVDALMSKYTNNGAVQSPIAPMDVNGGPAFDDKGNGPGVTADDTNIVPSTFGKGTASDSAAAQLAEAERHLHRQNNAACRDKAIAILKTFQDGAWSVWHHISSVSTRAEELVLEVTPDANTILQAYGPLIEGEQNVPKWEVACYLMKLVGSRFAMPERLTIVRHAIEHVRLLVGDAPREIAMFNYLDGIQETDPLLDLFGMILWSLEHPIWLRRANAARVLLWLIEEEQIYFKACAALAFVDGRGLAGEIALGAIDTLSSRQPATTWGRLADAVDVTSVATNNEHIGRTAVLLRIAERAAKHGNVGAASIVDSVKRALRPSTTALLAATAAHSTPGWAVCVEKELRKITPHGWGTHEVMRLLEDELRTVCAPLSIDQAMQLETLLAKSRGEQKNHSLGRWSGTVRHALGKVFHHYVSFPDMRAAEAALRIYNPHAPEQTMLPGFCAPGKAMVDAMARGRSLDSFVGDANNFYLHYLEIFVNDQGATQSPGHMVEVFAVIVPDAHMQAAALQGAIRARFSSLGYPDAQSMDMVGATCVRVSLEHAYFGSYTPGFPTPSFLSMTRLVQTDLTRISWRNGRSTDVQDFGRSQSEGCLVSVPRAALALPDGMQVMWVIKVDGELACVVDRSGREIDG